MIEKTRENLTFEKLKKEEERLQSFRESLKELSLDLKNGKDLDKVIKELDLSLKHKRNYKAKISFEEWCEINGYIAGFGRYSKGNKSFPETEIKNLFYSKK